MDSQLTATEQKIEDAIKNNPQVSTLRNLVEQFRQLVLLMSSQGIHQDILAVAASAHLTSMLSAQKMSGLVKPEFIDVLLDDLIDTVRNRAFVGEVKLRTK